MIEIVVSIVVAAFLVITVLTIGNVFNFAPIVRNFPVKPRFEDHLFKALVIEIIAICLTVAGAYFDDRRELVKERDEANATLELTLNSWEGISRVWMDEPSGSSTSGLTDPASEGAVLVGVDDEESALFVLNTKDGHFPLVRSYIELVGSNGKAIADDLEAVTYDGSKYYYAIASHRLTGKASKARKVRRLLKFEIPEEWESGYSKVVVTSPTDLTDLPEGGVELDTLLRQAGVDLTNWRSDKVDPPHPFGLEIEGIVYSGGTLFIGLKWPLDNEAALLLGYNISSESFSWIRRLKLTGEDGLPQGITGLAINGDHLLVASNPPQKVDVDHDPGSVKYYGKSKLWAFPLAVFETTGNQEPLDGTPVFLAVQDNTKLEGIASEGNKLYLSFEGDRQVFRIVDLPEIL